MMCSFEGPPRIVRLHGRGEPISPGDPRFDELLERCDFEDPGPPDARRAIVRVDVTRVSDSCGYGVPLMSFEGIRPHLHTWAAKKVRVGGPEALREYEREHNAESLDGLPAVDPASRGLDLSERAG